MIEAGGMCYLYNIGAKKYVRRTGISLTPALSESEGEIYDLSGRKMANGKSLNGRKQGIYIKDGKKIVHRF